MLLSSLPSSTSVRWTNCLLLFSVSMLSVPLTRVGAFNIGLSGARVIKGKAGTLFGATLNFLPETSKIKIPDEVTLLVSAPKQKTKSLGDDVLGVVHICTDIFKPNPLCTPFYDEWDQDIRNAQENEQFGFAVAVNNDGSNVICSPHYTDTVIEAAYFIIGRCSVVYSKQDPVSVYVPFLDQKRDWKTYVSTVNMSKEVSVTAYYGGLASFGFSVDLGKSDFFVAGAPGVMEGEGSVIFTNFVTNTVTKLEIPLVYNINTTAFSYLGYDVKIGRFCDNSETCFAASAPNLNLVGGVQIFKKTDETRGTGDIERVQLIQGSQAWAYFGYSLAVCDVNSDGWDELLVGAPQYTDGPSGHDEGRVYVFSRTDTDQELQNHITLKGSGTPFARFGSAIQCIGDINLDGYIDVAVGAPNEDDGIGSVHIYLGSPSGLSNPSHQIISGASLPDSVTGFGYAISRSQITPRSNYPILAVSSIEEDAVVVLNTRSIVDANVTLTATPNLIDLNIPCQDSNIDGPCFTVELCLNGEIRGGGIWDNIFKINLAIDTNVKLTVRKRALFRMYNTSLQDTIEMTLNSTARNCVAFTAVVIKTQVNQDRFSPVNVEVQFSLESTTEDNTTPVLDAMAPQSKSTTVTFTNDCGDNNICEVDLSVSGKLDYFGQRGEWTSIVINDTKELLVELIIKNSQETNYWTVIEISVNSDLQFSRTTPSTEPSVSCQAVTQDADTIGAIAIPESKVVCNYYKPLKHGETIKVGVAFHTYEISLEKKTLTVTAKVMPKNRETSKEDDPSDNTVMLYTDVRIIADVAVNGLSSPTEMTIQHSKKISLDSKTDIYDENKGSKDKENIEDLSLTHKFLIKNEGPSFLLPTIVRVSIPFYLVDASRFVEKFNVQITHASGEASVCKGLRNFENIKRVIATTTASTAASLQTDTTQKSGKEKIITDDSKSTTPMPMITTTGSDFLVVDPNRRRRRSPLSRQRRSTSTVSSNIYVQSCKLDPDYCQVFECDLSQGLKRDEYAEVNASLVVDKANIPIPEDFNTFWYEVRAKVIQPRHELMQEWEEEDGTGNSVTKFHLVESGGKINIWIIIGSIIGGLVLITIVVLILWKAGFFKRNKHQQVAQWKRESQRRSRYSSVPRSEKEEKE